MRLSISVARPNLISLGTCFGKFTKAGKFRLHITALDHIAQYAKYKVWVKPNGEMPFLYGNHVLKAHLGRITEDTPEHQGVVVFSMNDVPLGFGVTARSTIDTRKLDPTSIIVFHQAIQDQDMTPENIRDVLSAVDDDLWVVAACVDRLVNNVDTQQSLLELGITRTNSAVHRAQAVPRISTPDAGILGVHNQVLTRYFDDAPEDGQLCRMRAVLLHRCDRLSSFVQICKDLSAEEGHSDDIDEEWEDDPWAEDGETSPLSPQHRPVDPPIPLSDFLAEDMLGIACLFASQQQFTALRTLMLYHSSTLWPSRFAILDSIPSHIHPSEYREILPAYDVDHDAEQTPCFDSWRTELDWVETPEVDAALKASQAISFMELDSHRSQTDATACTEPLGPKELSAWYKRRVDIIISSTGILDIALATVQHGASHGVPDLDELGEELSLLSRLVYDSPQPHEPQDSQDWTLSRWQSMQPAEVVGAYLAHSSPETVAKDITRLVMPYLFPSKATLPVTHRIIRNDEDVARLALACLYGSDSCTEWSTMSSVFECLPAWEIKPGTEDEADEADATIISLGTFVAPSTTRPQCSPSDLMLFFKPLPLVSLSRALDILDVHLESGEILSRWNVAAPLRWFLQSANDAGEQRARANRMARRTGSSDELSGRDEWEWLLENMLKLCGSSETGLKSAFGLLSREEVSSIFFAGLLSSGSFDIAGQFLQQRHGKLSLPPLVVEDICLSVSSEFYDNASSGNYKTGDMKLAYDCLAVPPPSERLNKERNFIEATSRLSSFNIFSRPGVPLSPIEIRLTKDRLSLISRVLSSTTDAYKHTEVILDLLYKLGFEGDVVAEVRVLAMLSGTALQAEDFSRAYETSKRMIRKAPNSIEDKAVREASDVCWVACFQLGRHPEFEDVEAKLSLLGRALQLCPADRMHDVLASWRRLEKEDIESRHAYLASRTVTQPKRTSSSRKHVSSLRERLGELHMPTTPLINADAAALAGRAFNRMASNFTFAVTGRGQSSSSGDDARPRSRDGMSGRFDGDEVSAQASRVLQKGIGWLLGADDDD
ncbi:secretory pathway protein Sec39-domain-containing protein [Boletus edulis]|nr:secretory pathway protein Sec39-domain-containing protein [Boletus edulis]